MPDETRQITQLLRRWRQGQDEALEQLVPLVYAELKGIAKREFRHEAAGHTLQPTALINEAVLRLGEADISWHDRCHFLAMMTTTMRRVLVDHARSRQRQKRGGDWQQVTLQTKLSGQNTSTDILDLDRAIDALAQHDQRKAQIIQLHYFGGMQYREMAIVLNISEATVQRDLQFSRAWLQDYLHTQSPV